MRTLALAAAAAWTLVSTEVVAAPIAYTFTGPGVSGSFTYDAATNMQSDVTLVSSLGGSPDLSGTFLQTAVVAARGTISLPFGNYTGSPTIFATRSDGGVFNLGFSSLTATGGTAFFSYITVPGGSGFNGGNNGSAVAQPVPEPISLAVFGFGLAGLAAARQGRARFLRRERTALPHQPVV